MGSRSAWMSSLFCRQRETDAEKEGEFRAGLLCPGPAGDESKDQAALCVSFIAWIPPGVQRR